ncbi:patatin-like phospholipase family protein [uncultured Rhodoblastus sp.]|uniref:patatin-like phospholipase family protein n=1 Tax=uncultured Rhodoblastus sp. TaxID=543037 RepID=UPI0025F26289|nr:patatin-like phospholipase family protein [uncultured Rhodoblastus sp.]
MPREKKPAPEQKPARKKINLALQGGGAHGAFTWGVLDKLLEDGRFAFDALSGTSAGAMNAVNLAEGQRKGGVQGARDQLAQFWRASSLDGGLAPVQRDVIEGMLNFWNATPFATIVQQAAGMFSPSEMNPLNLNPLRDVLAAQVDFDALRASDGVKLFIAATNVESGKVRVFHRPELTIDMVMASACLPTVFRAVMVDGVPYWDGGFMGNPVLFPFFYETETLDIVLIQINPIERKGAPDTVAGILGRIDEITFNSSLLQEFRAINFVARLIAEGRLAGTNYKSIRLHVIEAQDELNRFGAASRMRSDYDFFVQLRDIGRTAAKKFLDAHYDDVGVRQTFDIQEALV